MVIVYKEFGQTFIALVKLSRIPNLYYSKGHTSSHFFNRDQLPLVIQSTLQDLHRLQSAQLFSLQLDEIRRHYDYIRYLEPVDTVKRKT